MTKTFRPVEYNLMKEKLLHIISDMESGKAYPLMPEELNVGRPGFNLPDALTPLFHVTKDASLKVDYINITLTSQISTPVEFVEAGVDNFTLLLENRFLVIGTEDRGVNYLLAADLQRDNFPVCTVDFDFFSAKEGPSTPAWSVVTLEPVAPSLVSFLKCLVEVEDHYSMALYKTVPRSLYEARLKEELENICGSPINRTWWISRLSEGYEDYFWNQFQNMQADKMYKDTVKDDINADEALFSLFSIMKHKKLLAIKYCAVIEDHSFIPVLFDVLADTKDQETEDRLITAIVNCRGKAIPYLAYAVQHYPVLEGRLKAIDLLVELNHTQTAERLIHQINNPDTPSEEKYCAAVVLDIHEKWIIEKGGYADTLRDSIKDNRETIAMIIKNEPPCSPPEDFPVIYQAEWPPFDESDFTSTKHIIAFLIVLIGFAVAGIFYYITHSIASMLLGASAVAVVYFFIPDLGSGILRKKLASSDYTGRIIDISKLKKEIESGNVARCITYSKKHIAPSPGYLCYLKSDLQKGENRPFIFLCKPGEFDDVVERWYTKGLIPNDGLRSEKIKAFWNKMPDNRE